MNEFNKLDTLSKPITLSGQGMPSNGVKYIIGTNAQPHEVMAKTMSSTEEQTLPNAEERPSAPNGMTDSL
jgi:hypothetical protein